MKTQTADIPMVPQDRYDALWKHFQELQDQYFQLVEKVIDMKRGGMDYRPIVEEFEDHDPHEVPTEVMDAILERAAEGSPDAYQMKETAHGMIRSGMKPEDVAKQVLAGEDLGL